jgi:hypothetical protein
VCFRSCVVSRECASVRWRALLALLAVRRTGFSRWRLAAARVGFLDVPEMALGVSTDKGRRVPQ